MPRLARNEKGSSVRSAIVPRSTFSSPRPSGTRFRERLLPLRWTVNHEVGRSCTMAFAHRVSLARAPLGAHLAPRRQPVQERARKTVELILDTAAALLEEAGVEAFNTNLLAERAGVRVRTVYRYFPNKLAVMTAVAERLAEEWDGWFEGFRALSDPRSSWRTLWVAYIGTFVDGIRRVRGGLAIRRAMRALPELQAIDRQDNERLARQLAAAIERRGVVVPLTRLHGAANHRDRGCRARPCTPGAAGPGKCTHRRAQAHAPYLYGAIHRKSREPPSMRKAVLGAKCRAEHKARRIHQGECLPLSMVCRKSRQCCGCVRMLGLARGQINAACPPARRTAERRRRSGPCAGHQRASRCRC